MEGEAAAWIPGVGSGMSWGPASRCLLLLYHDSQSDRGMEEVSITIMHSAVSWSGQQAQAAPHALIYCNHVFTAYPGLKLTRQPTGPCTHS